MVICLMLAVGALLWPSVALPRSPRVSAAPVGELSGGVNVAGSAGGPVNRRGTPVTTRQGWRAAGVAAGSLVVGLFFVMAGLAGAVAAGAAMLTGTVLVRRALADRRGRVALVDIQSGLRMLGRELRAGAEPSVAATNACSAARGEGAEVLRTLARLTRADDRSADGGGAADGGRPVAGHWALADKGRTATTMIDAAAGAGAGVGPRAQVQDRLRSGWLLTRRHGLAFTPLIDALAADLAEQIVAAADRAGQVAGPRMSGYVMAVLPLMGLVLGVGMGADPFRVLLSTPVGNILLLVGVALTCAGLLWSARIVRQ